MYDKILLAIDDSKASEKAIERALEFKKNFKTEITAFHSIEHHMIPKEIPLTVPFQNANSFTIPPTSYREIKGAYEAKGEKILNNAQMVFKEEGLNLETHLVTGKEPADYIEEVVERENFNLVIMGHRGSHSKLEDIFLGSVAKKVLESVECDVLIIK
ncbi:MAG: universal stress protein [Promethearchaeota archaeon]|nr:MAG: universal stress protein [Candidatus Lokiarchaeota archaeon]